MAPASIFGFHRNRISSETTGGISQKPCIYNSSQCLDVSTRKQFQSVNKYGRKASIFKIAICPLLNTVAISLSHLHRDHWSDVFDPCPRYSTICLGLYARKWFRSVHKYGRRQPTLIFTVIASPLKSLEEFCRNLVCEFLSMPRCVHPKMILVRRQMWPNGSHL